MSRYPEVARTPFVLHAVDDATIPIIIDTGASISITPNISDFVGPIRPPSIDRLQGLGDGDGCQVDGEGTIEWQIRDVVGTMRILRTSGYLAKTAPIRLFSSQTYFKEKEEGYMHVDWQRTELTLHDGTLLTFRYADNNIPCMMSAWQPIVGVTLQDCSTLTNTRIVGMSVGEETNQNLTSRQKELLLWHWKLGHCHFGWIQRLAREPRNGRRKVLETKVQISTAECPYCAACTLSMLQQGSLQDR
jgi:hypothetical protein